MIWKFKRGLAFLTFIVLTLLFLVYTDKFLPFLWDQKHHPTTSHISQFTRDVKDGPNRPDTYRNHWKPRGKKKSNPLSKLKVFLLFIGYPRSGSTLMGSLIDAHPHAIVSNEYDILHNFVNFNQSQRSPEYIFNQLYQNSRNQKYRKPSSHHLFSYFVPGQWQGKYKGNKIAVLGDKRAAGTSRKLGPKKIHLLRDIAKLFNVPVKLIHIIRNPFDNIATMALRLAGGKLRDSAFRGVYVKYSNTTVLETAVRRYSELVQINVSLRKKLGSAVIDIHYSEFVKKPHQELVRLWNFLGVEFTEQYIDSCVKVIFTSETNTRKFIDWPPYLLEKIEELIQEVDFLRSYTFEIH